MKSLLLSPRLEIMKGTIPSTFISILSNVIGGGVLAISLAMHYTSLIPGLMMFTIITIISLISMSMLIRMSEFTQCFSYMELCHYAFEKAGFNSPICDKALTNGKSKPRRGPITRLERAIVVCVELSIFVYTFSCCVMYIIIIADSMEPLSRHCLSISGFCGTGAFWTLMSLPVLVGLSALRQITDLKIVSVLSFLTILYTAVIACIKYYQISSARHTLLSDSVNVMSIKPDFFKSIPIFTVCYGMHYNIPPLYKELRRRSISKMNRALYPSYVIIIAMYLQVGLVGYFHFGSLVTQHGGDLLAQYSESDLWINVGRLLMIVHFLFVFPLLAIGCRRSINLFLFKGEDRLSLTTRLLESTAIVVTASGLAFVARGISNVLALSGSLCGVHIIITFPALMYKKIFYRTISRKMTIIVWIFTVAGVFFSLAGLCAQIYGIICA